MSEKRIKIAVFGLGNGAISEQNKRDAFKMGKLIAESGNYLITGLAKGITEFASKGAQSANGIVIGINPYSKIEEDKNDVSYADTDIVINTGQEDRGRNVVSVRTCDAMIIINGNFGVLNEITIGVGENKPIIVVKNSGGIADIIEEIFKALKPDYKKLKIVDDIDKIIPTIKSLVDE
jgi:uncharacterized protein (TIGR00725 family)